MVMEKLYGQDKIRKFLKYELDRYLRARGGELVEELPLIRVENQPYIHYRKGSLVMYLLQDGSARTRSTAALRRLLARVRVQGRALSALARPDRRPARRRRRPSKQAADHRPVREDHALRPQDHGARRSTQRADGRYDVTLTVEAKKLYADGKGKETPAPMAETLRSASSTSSPAAPATTRAR